MTEELLSNGVVPPLMQPSLQLVIIYVGPVKDSVGGFSQHWNCILLKKIVDKFSHPRF